jgi:hypothetical protein
MDKLNPGLHISFSNAMRGISYDMYQFDDTQKGATPQEDLQARMAEHASKMQQTFNFHRVQYPVVPEPADIATSIAHIVSQGKSEWQTYAAQYMVEMPYEVHQAFADKMHAELQELNIMSDGQSVASMATAAYRALDEMSRDESLSLGTRMTLAGLKGQALDQALEAGVNADDLGDFEQGDDEIGDND